MRYADAPFDARDVENRSAHISNVDLPEGQRRHTDATHYFEMAALKRHLAEPEGQPFLTRTGGLTPEAAYARIERRLERVCAQLVRAWAPQLRGGGAAKPASSASFPLPHRSAGAESGMGSSRRGRWLLLGLDVAVDEALHPRVLEANLNPELTLDGPRTRLNRRLAKRTFDLLLEAHAKAKPLFRPNDDANGDEGCAAQAFQPASADSQLGRNLTRTGVLGWTLLYSEAVSPPYVHATGQCYEARDA